MMFDRFGPPGFTSTRPSLQPEQEGPAGAQLSSPRASRNQFSAFRPEDGRFRLAAGSSEHEYAPRYTPPLCAPKVALFEYNDTLPGLNKSRARKTPPEAPFPPKRVRFFLNNGSFRKFAGLLDLRETGFTESVLTLNAGCEYQLLGGGLLRALPAYHDELLSRDHAVGLLVTFGDGDGQRRILLTSDTGLFPLKRGEARPTADDSNPTSEIGRRYAEALHGHSPDLMLVHIGSIKKDEFDPQRSGIAESCYPNHLGIIGSARVIATCKPKLAVISEFGEEMRDFRFDLIKDLRDTVLRLYFQDKGGNSPRVVPGDLAFVYSVADRAVLDCVSGKWSPSDTIDFWEVKNDDKADIYYAAKLPPPADCKTDARFFSEQRKAHRGLYFAAPSEPKP